MKTIDIYTDGACKGNPGVGGWGALLKYQNKEKTLLGAEANTTNNRMELLAPINALASLKEKCQVNLYTDSTYVQKGITEWINNWKKRNWQTAAKKPVLNKDLWQQLDKLNQQHQVDWQWVKGHAGNAGNEIADSLANQAITEYLNN